MPLTPELIVIQVLVVVAAQMQLVLLALIVTSPVSEPDPCARLVGTRASPQLVPHWVSDRNSPAMFSTPERGTTPRFALTE